MLITLCCSGVLGIWSGGGVFIIRNAIGMQKVMKLDNRDARALLIGIGCCEVTGHMIVSRDNPQIVPGKVSWREEDGGFWAVTVLPLGMNIDPLGDVLLI